jgi:hypothetical protein
MWWPAVARAGCILENNRSNNATIIVTSEGDRFDDNGLGCDIGGGLTNAQTGSASFNTTRFDAYGSWFTNNTRVVFNTAAGGPLFSDKGDLVSSPSLIARRDFAENECITNDAVDHSPLCSTLYDGGTLRFEPDAQQRQIRVSRFDQSSNMGVT